MFIYTFIDFFIARWHMQCMQSAILLWQVHPSLRLTNAAIVSKQMDVSPRFLDDLVYRHHSVF